MIRNRLQLAAFISCLTIVSAFSVPPVEAVGSSAKIYFSEASIYGTAIIALQTGETLVGGTTYEHRLYGPHGLIDPNGYYGFFAKFDSSGKALIHKTFESEDHSSHVAFNSMSLLRDGGVLLAGLMIPHSRPGADMIILRLNASGEMVWKKTIGTRHLERFASMIATPEGEFLLTAIIERTGTGSAKHFREGLLIKGNASGAVLWKRKFRFASDDLEIYPNPSITKAHGGGYLLSTVFEMPEEIYGVLLIKFSNNGAVQWKKNITFGNQNILADEYYTKTSIASTSDGGFILASTSSREWMKKSFMELLKLDASGKVSWAKSYESAESIRVFGDVRQTSDGGYLIGGASGFGWDGLLMKVNKEGRPLWGRKFVFRPGGADSVYAATETANGGYLATGTVVDTQQPSAVPGRLPIFTFFPASDKSCNNFRNVTLKALNHEVSSSVPELIVEKPRLKVRKPALEEEIIDLESSDCNVVWE